MGLFSLVDATVGVNFAHRPLFNTKRFNMLPEGHAGWENA
jgi:hypothetical protein